ncbi:protein stoned-A [Nylanderia fulva]|uniref:protein stoned-A n=1 Tax=Nylanderia fulva TaxID=613905 RepID=UPI0010FB48D8|nr:protein stoned-A [Nylanderia fulva]
MHKLAKGLKKKKKPKKGKKGAEEEFDPEELERYRRERAEAQQKVEEAGESTGGKQVAGSDEWKKFQALTAGVDSVLRKTQDDLDRIKSTSFFQRKAPLEEKKPQEEADQAEAEANKSKRWVGFDAEGNPIEAVEVEGQDKRKKESVVHEDGFVDVPEDEDEQEDSADEDIFDTTYVDVLQNIDVQLAYIPDSPTEEEAGDDPFDTTSADKVLKTVDKKGNRLVSLGNAVEVLSGRIDHVSTCKLTKRGRPRLQQDLLLDDFEEPEQLPEAVGAEPVEIERTLLDDDSDLPDIPIDLTKLPPVLPRPVTPVTPLQEDTTSTEKVSNGPLDISEFEILKEKTVLEEIPDLDDAEFDLSAAADAEPAHLEEAEDPFAEKEPETVDFQTEIIEASFEAATFVDEVDPFDTAFADNILPGKTELKFIEKELEELPVSEVSISLTDPAGFNRDYETGLLKLENEQEDDDVHHQEISLQSVKKDLLGGSATDLSQLADEPIAPVEEITYVDPFDTSAVKELPPGKTELKVLEKELLGEQAGGYVEDDNEDDDFDPRKDEEPSVRQPPPARPPVPVKPVFEVNFDEEETKVEATPTNLGRKTSRPEILELTPSKAVAFELPTPSKRPDLLATTEEEKSLPSKPLTPYYSQKSIEESLPLEDEEVDVDPFDTSFVNSVAPGKTELKLIESELLRQEPRLPHSLSDHDFDPRSVAEPIRRQSDFTATSVAPSSLKLEQLRSSLIQKVEEEVIVRQEPQRQESLLDAEVEVDAKPLTPRIESKPIEEEEISYSDPFDTSIAINILPGKAELKILESELEQIPQQPPPRPIQLPAVVPTIPVVPVVPEIDDFDPRADEVKESKDFLSLDGQDPGDKVLTPLQNKDFSLDEDVDPFDTSFATIEPGRTELKLLESELMK